MPAMYVAIQAVLSLYASGRTTGIIMKCDVDIRKDLYAPRPSSSPASWEWRPAASTRPPTTPSSTGSASKLSFQETNPSNNQLGPRVSICLVNGICFSFSLVVPIPQTKSTHSFSKSKLLLMKQNRPEYFE